MQRTIPMNLIDYRDRASVLIWVVLLGLAAQRFLALPARSFTTTLLGSPVTLAVTDNTILGLCWRLVASGTEAVFVRILATWADDTRVHPAAFRRGRGNRLGQSRPAGIIGSSGVCRLRSLPWLSCCCRWRHPSCTGSWVDSDRSGAGVQHGGHLLHGRSVSARLSTTRLGMNALTYAVALVLFLVVYRTRVRSIVSATEVLWSAACWLGVVARQRTSHRAGGALRRASPGLCSVRQRGH